MAVSSINIEQLWTKAASYQKQLNFALILLLSLYLIWYAAMLTWRLFPSPEQSANSPVVSNTANKSKPAQTANIRALQRLNLFGEFGKAPEVETPQQTDAPETNLKLTLTGLVASSESNGGAAIIENRGSQNTYGIGEKVDGTRAIVKEVLVDRIIISNGGRLETLMLDGVDFAEVKETKVVAVKPHPNTLRQKSPRRNESRQLSQSSAEMAAQLRTSPAKFTDFIAIQPYRAEGRIQGYRVNPGRDPVLFKEVGLQPNDVLTEINGLDLTDIKQSMEAMQMLKGAEALDLTVSRNGDTMTLSIELPEQ